MIVIWEKDIIENEERDNIKKFFKIEERYKFLDLKSLLIFRLNKDKVIIKVL